MKKIPAILAALVVAGVVWAGAGTVGNGGLSGPAGSGSSGASFGFDGGPITASSLKVDVLDAGVALINGQLQVLGPSTFRDTVTVTGVSAVAVDSNGRITWGGGNYITNDGTSGRMVSTGGVVTPSYALGIGSTGMADSSTAPTVTACTSPSMTWSNGNALFQFDVGTSCTGVSTAVITLPTAGHGWECKCTNTTAPSTRSIDSSAWSTTTVTITNYSRTAGTAADFADGADIRCMCRAG